MFRIGVVELASSCGIILLVLIIPIILRGFYTRLDQRLKKIEKKIDRKN
jgi:hypothetical protein